MAKGKGRKLDRKLAKLMARYGPEPVVKRAGKLAERWDAPLQLPVVSVRRGGVRYPVPGAGQLLADEARVKALLNSAIYRAVSCASSEQASRAADAIYTALRKEAGRG